MTEADIMKKIQIRASELGRRLFRNNVGQAWTASKTFRPESARLVVVTPEDIVLYKARRIKFGLGVGSGDLIGFRTVTITESMVGSRLAVFESVECKTKRGVIRDQQKTWAAMVRKFGGVALIARHVDDYEFGQ